RSDIALDADLRPIRSPDASFVPAAGLTSESGTGHGLVGRRKRPTISRSWMAGSQVVDDGLADRVHSEQPASGLVREDDAPRGISDDDPIGYVPVQLRPFPLKCGCIERRGKGVRRPLLLLLLLQPAKGAHKSPPF